tara:strand:+ start:75 stop:587 length:513 start_codon:yes stop_codon:yes gene_type:complete
MSLPFNQICDVKDVDYIKCDDYMTPKSAWENIKDYIPRDKVIWEAFYGDGKSGNYLKELGFDTIHEPIDFFNEDRGEAIVSNPPFALVKKIVPRLIELDKPFILILPVSKLNTQYFRAFKDKIQLIIPPSRIHFDKKVDGETPDGWKNSCYFDCFYYCYKMNLASDITWI